MKSNSNFFRYSYALFDITALNLVSFAFVILLRRIRFSDEIIIFFIFNNVTWLLSSYFTALYVDRFTKIHRFLRRTLQCFAIHFVIIQSFVFFVGFDYSRLFVLFNLAALLLILMVSRILILKGGYFLKSHPRFSKKIVILGHNETSLKLIEYLKNIKGNVTVEGYFDNDAKVAAEKMLGTISETLAYCLENHIDEIYSTFSPEKNELIHDLALRAEKNFIRFKFIPDFRMFVDREIHIEFARDMPIVSLRAEPLEDVGNRIRKGFFDVVFSLAVIILLLSWLIPLIALLIKLDSRGPVFFKQLRSGKNNVPFLCFKFRSLKQENRNEAKQVTKGDRRLTRLGRILRKTSIDELPQFYNVLRGEMSVVGPRPHMLEHTEQFAAVTDKYMIRHYVKPGITGLAQINGYRGEITNPNELHGRIEHDIRYFENWSMWYDFNIIVLTVYRTITGDKKAV